MADEIALYDLNGAKATAEILDLQHGLQFVPSVQVAGGDALEVCRDSDVVVITAGAKQKPGQSRMELAGANAAITRQLVPQLLDLAPECVMLFVTNPVDVVTYIAQESAATAGVDPSPRDRVGHSARHLAVASPSGDDVFCGSVERARIDRRRARRQ